MENPFADTSGGGQGNVNVIQMFSPVRRRESRWNDQPPMSVVLVKDMTDQADELLSIDATQEPTLGRASRSPGRNSLIALSPSNTSTFQLKPRSSSTKSTPSPNSRGRKRRSPSAGSTIFSKEQTTIPDCTKDVLSASTFATLEETPFSSEASNLDRSVQARKASPNALTGALSNLHMRSPVSTAQSAHRSPRSLSATSIVCPSERSLFIKYSGSPSVESCRKLAPISQAAALADSECAQVECPPIRRKSQVDATSSSSRMAPLTVLSHDGPSLKKNSPHDPSHSLTSELERSSRSTKEYTSSPPGNNFMRPDGDSKSAAESKHLDHEVVDLFETPENHSRVKNSGGQRTGQSIRPPSPRIVLTPKSSPNGILGLPPFPSPPPHQHSCSQFLRNRNDRSLRGDGQLILHPFLPTRDLDVLLTRPTSHEVPGARKSKSKSRSLLVRSGSLDSILAGIDHELSDDENGSLYSSDDDDAFFLVAPSVLAAERSNKESDHRTKQRKLHPSTSCPCENRSLQTSLSDIGLATSCSGLHGLHPPP